MNVVIADNPPRLCVATDRYVGPTGTGGVYGETCGWDPPHDCPVCFERPCPLWGDGAALAREYVRSFPFADHAKYPLADWLDDNQSDLALPAHLRAAVGQAVRDGCPDAAAGKPLEVAR